jgi:hypothetical protein
MLLPKPLITYYNKKAQSFENKKPIKDFENLNEEKDESVNSLSDQLGY